MLTDGRVRNGLINPARHWPTRSVPFFIDRVFSEYCSTKVTMSFAGRGGNNPFLISTALGSVNTGVCVDQVMAIITPPYHTKLSHTRM